MPRRLVLIPIALIAVGLVLVALIGLTSRTVTRYVEGPAFRAEIEKETGKGLHFEACHFDPIHRTGILTASSEGAVARNGRKAMTSLEAHAISGRFNPAGVFFRRWSIDDLHVERAEIGIQTYEPVPEPTPGRPWFALFLPDRVYLKHVWSNHVDITWRLRGQRAGIFDTRLVITPHGRDFNYTAAGGVLQNPLLPELQVRQMHLVITKTVFSLHDMDLGSGKSGTVHAEGTAATRGENKNVDFNFAWQRLPLSQWLPADWRNNVAGNASGDLRWTGRDYKLRSATMDGSLNIADAQITGVKLLGEIAALANRPDLHRLELTECHGRFRWEQSNIDLRDFVIEQRGKFRIEGDINVKDRRLGGKIELGLTSNYLTWLPQAEGVFARQADGYAWTTVHLSGTLDSPQQDLSPRILDALKQSPGALLGAALRQFSAWLRGD